MLNIDLSGKRILVTGGAGDGVGAGLCEAVAEAGGKLIINDLDEETARRAAAKYEHAVPVVADVSNVKAVDRMFMEIRQKYGVVHGLINNAGVGLGKYAHEATEEEFDHLYDVDVKGVWAVSRAFVRQLLEHGATGHIVNIASVHAFATMPKMAVYASAKAAVAGMTRGLAVELGQHNIRCNAIAPGMVYSAQSLTMIKKWAKDPQQWIDDHRDDQQSLNSFVTARDCGNIAVFLLSDLSRSITGQTFYADNGTTSMIYNNRYARGD